MLVTLHRSCLFLGWPGYLVGLIFPKEEPAEEGRVTKENWVVGSAVQRPLAETGGCRAARGSGRLLRGRFSALVSSFCLWGL